MFAYLQDSSSADLLYLHMHSNIGNIRLSGITPLILCAIQIQKRIALSHIHFQVEPFIVGGKFVTVRNCPSGNLSFFFHPMK